METSGHLLFDCRFTHHLWARFANGLDTTRSLYIAKLKCNRHAKRKPGIGAIARCVFSMATALI